MARYHYDRPDFYLVKHGELYSCDHPIYDKCTLYKIGDKGLAVIQQKEYKKLTFWTYIDDYLVDQIYNSDGFLEYFNENAAEPVNDIYPTVTVRQIMYAVGMKPLEKKPWETVFDRRIKVC